MSRRKVTPAALAATNKVFMELEQFGLYECPPGESKDDPTVPWRITDAGSELLSEWDHALGLIEAKPDGSEFIPPRKAILAIDALGAQAATKLRAAGVVPEGMSDAAVNALVAMTRDLLIMVGVRFEVGARMVR